MPETREISREKVADCPGCPLGDEGGLVQVTMENSNTHRRYEEYRCGIENSDTSQCSIVYLANKVERALTKSSEAIYGPRLDGGP